MRFAATLSVQYRPTVSSIARPKMRSRNPPTLRLASIAFPPVLATSCRPLPPLPPPRFHLPWAPPIGWRFTGNRSASIAKATGRWSSGGLIRRILSLDRLDRLEALELGMAEIERLV